MPGPRRTTLLAVAVLVVLGLTAFATAGLWRPEGDPCRGEESERPVMPADRAGGGPPTFASGFEDRDFSDWSWSGAGDPTYVNLAVVDPEDDGVESRDGSAGRFGVTGADVAREQINSKLYQHFHEGDGDRTVWNPASVSGTYRAWYLLPPDYAVRPGAFVNIFQFKDQFWRGERGGDERSDPVWWVELGRATDRRATACRPDAPVALVKHWRDHERYAGGDYPGPRVPVPLGRWFEIRAEVFERDRIAFYLDGRPLGTASQNAFPVGPHHEGSFNWIFGVGHYGDNPGRLYVDDASFSPPPTTSASSR